MYGSCVTPAIPTKTRTWCNTTRWLRLTLVNSGRLRWVDALSTGQLVISKPAYHHLDDYDARVDSGPILAKAFGDANITLAELYSNAQERTESVIRKYRDDLSLNRDKHLRATMKIARHNYVTVKPGKGPLFGKRPPGI